MAKKISAKYSEQTHTELLLVGFLLIVVIIALSIQFSSVSVESRIKQKLAGKELTYYSFAGQPLTVVVKAGDIKSIRLEKCMLGSEMCWAASIETPLPWKIYYDKNTLAESGISQLFAT